MFITMLGDLTAFLGVVFGYFFFWTIHEDFPPADAAGPGWVWPMTAGLLLVVAWGATWGARVMNGRGGVWAMRGALAVGITAALAGSAALVAGPWLTGMDPTATSYQAIVWALVLWTGAHMSVGVIMQLYCLAASFAGRLTPKYDADMWNVSLYWHFMGFTALVTTLVIGGFPLLA
jgi:heme/copper-type cytochrome/quinol oxidase subunit 3